MYFVVIVLHVLKFFFAGTTANDIHFQAYLMNGLVRWNADRAADAKLTEGPNHWVYSGYLKYAVAGKDGGQEKGKAWEGLFNLFIQ